MSLSASSDLACFLNETFNSDFFACAPILFFFFSFLNYMAPLLSVRKIKEIKTSTSNQTTIINNDMATAEVCEFTDEADAVKHIAVDMHRASAADTVRAHWTPIMLLCPRAPRPSGRSFHTFVSLASLELQRSYDDRTNANTSPHMGITGNDKQHYDTSHNDVMLVVGCGRNHSNTLGDLWIGTTSCDPRKGSNSDMLPNPHGAPSIHWNKLRDINNNVVEVKPRAYHVSCVVPRHAILTPSTSTACCAALQVHDEESASCVDKNGSKFNVCLCRPDDPVLALHGGKYRVAEDFSKSMTLINLRTGGVWEATQFNLSGPRAYHAASLILPEKNQNGNNQSLFSSAKLVCYGGFDGTHFVDFFSVYDFMTGWWTHSLPTPSPSARSLLRGQQTVQSWDPVSTGHSVPTADIPCSVCGAKSGCLHKCPYLSLRGIEGKLLSQKLFCDRRTHQVNGTSVNNSTTNINAGSIIASTVGGEVRTIGRTQQGGTLSSFERTYDQEQNNAPVIQCTTQIASLPPRLTSQLVPHGTSGFCLVGGEALNNFFDTVFYLKCSEKKQALCGDANARRRSELFGLVEWETCYETEHRESPVLSLLSRVGLNNHHLGQAEATSNSGNIAIFSSDECPQVQPVSQRGMNPALPSIIGDHQPSQIQKKSLSPSQHSFIPRGYHSTWPIGGRTVAVFGGFIQQVGRQQPFLSPPQRRFLNDLSFFDLNLQRWVRGVSSTIEYLPRGFNGPFRTQPSSDGRAMPTHDRRQKKRQRVMYDDLMAVSPSHSNSDSETDESRHEYFFDANRDTYFRFRPGQPSARASAVAGPMPALLRNICQQQQEQRYSKTRHSTRWQSSAFIFGGDNETSYFDELWRCDILEDDLASLDNSLKHLASTFLLRCQTPRQKK